MVAKTNKQMLYSVDEDRFPPLAALSLGLLIVLFLALIGFAVDMNLQSHAPAMRIGMSTVPDSAAEYPRPTGEGGNIE